VIAELVHDPNVELEDALGADGNAESATLAASDSDIQRLNDIARVPG
jgi:hypothetical protein